MNILDILKKYELTICFLVNEKQEWGRLILCFLISFSFLNASSITKIPDKNIKDELQENL